MYGFINIDTTAFAAAVSDTDIVGALRKDVAVLSDKVRALETTRAIDNTQFDSDDNAFDQRVLDLLSDHDYCDEDAVRSTARNIAESVVDDIDFSDHVDEQIVKDALGLSWREEIITTDSLSDHFFGNVDMSDYVTSDDFNERLNDEVMSRFATHDDLKANFEALRDEVGGPKVTPQALCAVQTAITCLTEQVLRIQNLCGMTHSQDLLDAVMRVNKAMNTIEEV